MSGVKPDGEIVRELVDLLLDRKRADKDLGQHFLIDDSILTKTLDLSTVDSTSHVLEVGPGPGTLTHFLLAAGARVTAIEIDSIAVEHLHRVHGDAIKEGRLNLIEGDALRVGWPNDLTEVVSNPPYQISSPLIAKIDQWQLAAIRDGRETLRCVVLLLQEEFASRLVMEYGLASRGPLGINTALNWQSEMALKVPPHCFSPHPEVNSRVVTMMPHNLRDELGIDIEPRLLKRVVDHAFGQRRKKMRNRLKGIPRKIERVPGWNRETWKEVSRAILESPDDAVLESGWQDFRPEDLEVEEWLILIEIIEQTRDRLYD